MNAGLRSSPNHPSGRFASVVFSSSSPRVSRYACVASRIRRFSASNAAIVGTSSSRQPANALYCKSCTQPSSTVRMCTTCFQTFGKPKPATGTRSKLSGTVAMWRNKTSSLSCVALCNSMIPAFVNMFHLATERCRSASHTTSWFLSGEDRGRECGKADTSQQVLETGVAPQSVHARIHMKIYKPVGMLLIGFLQVFNRTVVFSQADMDPSQEVRCDILVIC